MLKCDWINLRAICLNAFSCLFREFTSLYNRYDMIALSNIKKSRGKKKHSCKTASHDASPDHEKTLEFESF